MHAAALCGGVEKPQAVGALRAGEAAAEPQRKGDSGT
jgi:hypothetical protein